MSHAGNNGRRGRVRPDVELDFFSDVVCPWCYLGHRRLHEAIRRLGADGEGIALRWRSFQLDPSAGAEPRDLAEALERKYGPGALDAMRERLGALGAAEGIEYRFDRALRVGTFDAHRLILWAQATHPGAVDLLVEAMFRAYFTEGANVADVPTLVRLAAGSGLDHQEASEALASGAFADAVRSDMAAALDAGITGVPAVAYNGAVVIPGAQDADTLEIVLRRLLAKVG